MRYVYYANNIIELFYEKPNIDSEEIIEVPDDFDLNPDMEYSIDLESKKVIATPIVRLEPYSEPISVQQDSFESIVKGSISII